MTTQSLFICSSHRPSDPCSELVDVCYQMDREVRAGNSLLSVFLLCGKGRCRFAGFDVDNKTENKSFEKKINFPQAQLICDQRVSCVKTS